MSFAREFEKVVSTKFEEVTGKLAGTDRKRFTQAAYQLGVFRGYQLQNPRKAQVWQGDVDAALLSMESIVAESAFDVQRAVNEAVAEVIGAAIGVGLTVLV